MRRTSPKCRAAPASHREGLRIGKQNLETLFEGPSATHVYHFTFDPAWDKICSGRTGFVEALRFLSLLNKGDTTFAVI